MCTMPKCCFKFCKNMRRSCQNDGITYFTFPGQITRRKQWIDIVREQRDEPFFEPNSGSVVCEKHFHDSNLYATAMGMKRLQRMSVPFLDSDYKERKEEDHTKLSIFENPFLPNTSYPDSDDLSDVSDTIENFDESQQKIKMDAVHPDMGCLDIKKEVEDENSTQLTSCVDPSQPGTSKLRYHYSSTTIDTNEKSERKKIKMETFHRDMSCGDIKKEVKDENSRQSIICEDPLPGTSNSGYRCSSTIGTNESCDEIGKKIKIEIEELSPNIKAENTKGQLDDLMSMRDKRYVKFGKYVAAMLKKMPLQQALDLQPHIVNLITSTMSDVGDGPRTLRITEGEET